MKNGILSLLLLPTIISCSTNSVRDKIINASDSDFVTINLDEVLDNEDGCYVEEFVDKIINIIPLETTEESLIHDPIYETIYTKDRVYLWDGYQFDGIIAFDHNGKFIKRLAKGQGPGEINQVADFTYDEESEQLVILSFPRLMFFDKNLNFIEEQIVPPGFGGGVRVLKDGYLLMRLPTYERDLNELDDYAFEITDKNFNSIKVMLHERTTTMYEPDAIKVGDSYRLCVPGSDTIYSFHDGMVEKKYVLDYKDKVFLTPDEESKYKYENMVKMPGTHFWGCYSETDNYQFFALDKQNNRYYIFRDKRTGIIKGGNRFFWHQEDLLGTYIPTTTYGDTMVLVSWPYNYPKGSLKSDKYISEVDRQKLENTRMEDNPYLILFTLKEFKDEE